jgi:hypothetical protein
MAPFQAGGKSVVLLEMQARRETRSLKIDPTIPPLGTHLDPAIKAETQRRLGFLVVKPHPHATATPPRADPIFRSKQAHA